MNAIPLTLRYAILLLLFPFAFAVQAAKAARPNVVLIYSDDQGWGDVGYHGYKDILTPNINELAANGMQFSQGYVCASVCGPSRAGLLTGVYQQRFGVYGNWDKGGVPTSQPLISEMLKRVGYRTAAIGKWHVGMAREELKPNARGVDFFYGFLSGSHDYSQSTTDPNHKKAGLRPILRNDKVEPPIQDSNGYLTEMLTKEAVQFIERTPDDEPFFVYLAYNAVHYPWDVPQSYVDRVQGLDTHDERKLFAGMVLAMDDGVGAVREALQEKGVADNTLVIFMSDNGSPRGQGIAQPKRKTRGQTTMSNPGPFNGFKGDTYEGGIRVPMVMHWPGKIPAGKTYKHPVSNLDLVSTIMSLNGVAKPNRGFAFDGVDLMPYLTGSKSGRPHEKLYWRRGEDYAVRQGDWKLAWNDQAGPQTIRLFNLKDDPGEWEDLSGKQPERAQSMQNLFDAWDSRLADNQAGRNPRNRNTDFKTGNHIDVAAFNSEIAAPPTPTKKNKPTASGRTYKEQRALASDRANRNGKSFNEDRFREWFNAKDKNSDGRLTPEEQKGKVQLSKATVPLPKVPVKSRNPDGMNILVLTVDDMNCDSVGAFGCTTPNTTPNMDRLAASSLSFAHAHVHATSCIPSRNVVQTGRYLFNSGIEGFYQLPRKQVTYPTTPDILRDHGFFTMIRGKSHHSSPYVPYPAWDINFDEELKAKKINVRDTKTFYEYTKKGIKAAQAAGKPFYFSMDIHDPHTALYSFSSKKGKITTGLNREDIDNPPSRIFQTDEITMPKFLPDTPLARQEMTAYYNSVRRADDSLGNVIKALKDTGVYDNTLIVSFSDHGMPFPFAKTAMYYHSTHTPLMVRWPGVTKAGHMDREHVVGTVDILPTLLEAFDITAPKGLDGRSLAPILRGKKQADRDFVYVMYEENVGGNRQPTRAILSKDHSYICNLWSDGERRFATATRGMATTFEMERLAKSGDPYMQERMELFNHAVPEQFFDLNKDPDALNNLFEHTDHQERIAKYQAAMIRIMKASNDPMLDVYQKRHDKAAVAGYLARLDAESKARKSDAAYSRSGRAKTTKKNKQPNKPTKKAKKSTSSDRPNIILIMADDMGRETVGVHGGLDYRTPVLDKLAAQGLSFDHCYSQPICTPSRVKLMTGKYNYRNYIGFGKLDPAEKTFGNALQNAGYETCITGKWQLSGDHDQIKAFGWDEYILCNGVNPIDRKSKPLWEGRERYWFNNKVIANGQYYRTKERYGPDIINEYAVNFIKRDRDKPFFLYYPMILPHSPWAPTPRSKGGDKSGGKISEVQYFKDNIEYIDTLVGRVVKALEESGQRENTIIMFTGDNGSGYPVPVTASNPHLRRIGATSGWSWSDYEEILLQPGDSSPTMKKKGKVVVQEGPLTQTNYGDVPGRKNRMLRDGTGVPCVMDWAKYRPAYEKMGHRHDDLIDFSDFFATVLDVAKTSVDYPTDGVSFAPRLRGEGEHQREYIFCHYWGAGRDPKKARDAIHDGNYKLYNDGRFFDLNNDSDELKPVDLKTASSQATTTHQRLQKHYKTLRGFAPNVEVAPSKSFDPKGLQTAALQKMVPAARSTSSGQAKPHSDGAEASPARTSPNVVLIFADDMGWGDVGYHGYKDVITPNIDRIAREGVQFSQGYVSASVCGPSRAGLMTGVYQQRVGAGENASATGYPDNMGERFRMSGLPTSQSTIAEILRPHGYRSGMIGKWHLGVEQPLRPHHRGFNYFYGFLNGSHSYTEWEPKFAQRKDKWPIFSNDRLLPAQKDIYLTDLFSDRAVGFIKHNPDKPFFLYLAYNAVHHPWQVPDKYLERTKHLKGGEDRRFFAAMILAMDDGVGRVFDTLEETGQLDNTMVIFLSDNGSPRGQGLKPKPKDAKMPRGETVMSNPGPHRGFKGDTYEGGIKVPFAIHWPGKIKPGTKYDHPVSALDIVPTIAATLGVIKPDLGHAFDGVDLLPFLNGDQGDTRPHETMYWRRDNDYAIREGDWKLQWNDASGNLSIKLFDLSKDPGEYHDVATKHPDLAQRLQNKFDTWDSPMPDSRPWGGPGNRNRAHAKGHRVNVADFNRNPPNRAPAKVR
jgi:arylsulfatase A-like enzyme